MHIIFPIIVHSGDIENFKLITINIGIIQVKKTVALLLTPIYPLMILLTINLSDSVFMEFFPCSLDRFDSYAIRNFKYYLNKHTFDAFPDRNGLRNSGINHMKLAGKQNYMMKRIIFLM